MEISESLKQEIERRRGANVAYQLLNDEEIVKEIEGEEAVKHQETTQQMEEKRKQEVQAQQLVTVRQEMRLSLAEWVTFYEQIWNIKIDFSTISIPMPREDFTWPIIMLNGMTMEKIVAKMREQMKVYVYNEPQTLKTIYSVRKPDKDYAVFVRANIEADEDLKNQSANDLANRNLNCITLEERLVFELFYFWKTKKHLDHNNYTLCAGSRYSDGGVPYVFWDSGNSRVYVGWYNAGYRHPSIRARAVVS